MSSFMERFLRMPLPLVTRIGRQSPARADRLELAVCQ